MKTSNVQSSTSLFPRGVALLQRGFSKLVARIHKWLTGATLPSTGPQQPSHRLDLMSRGFQGERKIFQICYPQHEKLPNPLFTGQQAVSTLSCQSVVKITWKEGRGWERKKERKTTDDREDVWFWYEISVLDTRWGFLNNRISEKKNAFFFKLCNITTFQSENIWNGAWETRVTALWFYASVHKWSCSLHQCLSGRI